MKKGAQKEHIGSLRGESGACSGAFVGREAQFGSLFGSFIYEDFCTCSDAEPCSEGRLASSVRPFQGVYGPSAYLPVLHGGSHAHQFCEFTTAAVP